MTDPIIWNGLDFGEPADAWFFRRSPRDEYLRSLRGEHLSSDVEDAAIALYDLVTGRNVMIPHMIRAVIAPGEPNERLVWSLEGKSRTLAGLFVLSVFDEERRLAALELRHVMRPGELVNRLERVVARPDLSKSFRDPRQVFVGTDMRGAEAWDLKWFF